MKFWFFPVQSGDLRLQAADAPGEVILNIEDPNNADRKLLTPFLKTMVEMGHLSSFPQVEFFGQTEVVLKGTMEELGPLLAGHIHADSKLWTAVRFYDGKITVQDGTRVPRPLSPPDDEGKQLPAERKKAEMTRRKVADIAGKKKAEAAVTVREPWTGCPPPETAIRRSSEVLRTFCTTTQWHQWEEHGAMKVVGNATGKAYWLHHRSVAAARGLMHLLVEAKSGLDICVWDDRVPAEEEALAIKLAVEHRENWLRGEGFTRPLAIS